ncbi:predicted protein [Histoplasma capsulatum G186AR]|uniref:Uncharacterized protein n=2 Tax=Ajellomyces capsulatus TaxID=5037 RepID=C0NHQ6_AJECG|nr:uncharacterized protein HCBG_02878 [Histoplasma capsulatum G186AR]EEH09341.1 predicted protein [Histoplasma capsulatum G186AR]KAG5303324.1 hypothetical protein I7I52_01293 [Histoplasma capsulatum]QSS68922.1 hypothetical protein I7I50_10055 [Histoplasma capsulatum G186AR]
MSQELKIVVECVVVQSLIRRYLNPLCNMYGLMEYGGIEDVRFPFQMNAVTSVVSPDGKHIAKVDSFSIECIMSQCQGKEMGNRAKGEHSSGVIISVASGL